MRLAVLNDPAHLKLMEPRWRCFKATSVPLRERERERGGLFPRTWILESTLVQGGIRQAFHRAVFPDCLSEAGPPAEDAVAQSQQEQQIHLSVGRWLLCWTLYSLFLIFFCSFSSKEKYFLNESEPTVSVFFLTPHLPYNRITISNVCCRAIQIVALWSGLS